MENDFLLDFFPISGWRNWFVLFWFVFLLIFFYVFDISFSVSFQKLRELEMENENIVFFFVFLLFFLFLCFEQIWEKKFRELKEKIINKKIFVSKEVKIFVFFFNLQYTIIDRRFESFKWFTHYQNYLMNKEINQKYYNNNNQYIP